MPIPRETGNGLNRTVKTHWGSGYGGRDAAKIENVKYIRGALLKRITVVTLTAALFLLMAAKGFSQSNRYWANNFSDQGALLSGAVVGGGTGPSAIFYNPGYISRIANSRFTVNADIIKLDSYRWENGLGQDEDISSFQPLVVPGFLSFLIKPKGNDRFTFQISALTRDESNFNLTHRKEDVGEYFPSVDGDEVYNAFFESNDRSVDLWVGFGLGYSVTTNFSIGISSFVSIKSRTESRLVDINVFQVENPASIGGEEGPFFSNFLDRVNRKALDWRWVNKVGASWTLPQWGFGATFTLPSLQLTSNGEVSKRLSYSNIPNASATEFRNFILVDSQEDIPVSFKDPASFSLGIRYQTANGKANLYATVEHFFPLDLYKSYDAAINPNITDRQTFNQLPNQDFLSEYLGAEAIWNVAFGVKYLMSPSVNLLAGFRTDFNYLKDVDFSEVHPFNQPLTTNDYDVLHFTLGTQVNIRKSHFVVGFQYSGGSQSGLPQIANFNPSIDDIITNPPLQGPIQNDLNVWYRSLAIILGFDLNLD